MPIILLLSSYSPQGYMFNMTLQMWFSRQIALGVGGLCCRDLLCVVCAQECVEVKVILRLLWNCLYMTSCTKTSGPSSQSTKLCCYPAVFFPSLIVGCLFLWAYSSIPCNISPESILSQSIKFVWHVFLQLSSPLYPPFNYFLVSAEARSIRYCTPVRFATPQIYVAAEGWLSNFLHGWQCRWHCVFLKALVRCALRTYGAHSHVILSDNGHFCHILPLACIYRSDLPCEV